MKLLDEFAPGVADGGAFFFEVGWEEHPDCAVVGFDADLGVGVWRFSRGWGFGGFDGFAFEDRFGEVAEVVVEEVGCGVVYDRADFGRRGQGLGWDGGRGHGDTVQL